MLPIPVACPINLYIGIGTPEHSALEIYVGTSLDKQLCWTTEI